MRIKDIELASNIRQLQISNHLFSNSSCTSDRKYLTIKESVTFGFFREKSQSFHQKRGGHAIFLQKIGV